MTADLTGLPKREEWPFCATRTKSCKGCAFRAGSLERQDGYGFLERIQKWLVDKLPHFCHENVPGHDEEVKDGSPRWLKCASQERFLHKFEGREQSAVSSLVDANIFELRRRK